MWSVLSSTHQASPQFMALGRLSMFNTVIRAVEAEYTPYLQWASTGLDEILTDGDRQCHNAEYN